jgi:alpha-L-rhamnosidase
LETTIPANSTATVYVPAKSAESVTESGTPLDKAKHVKFLRMEGDRVVLAVESGSYRLTAQP